MLSTILWTIFFAVVILIFIGPIIAVVGFVLWVVWQILVLLLERFL